MTDATAHGVAVVGSVQGGFPPIGLPHGIPGRTCRRCSAIAFSCFVLIIAQSAATSRSFAIKHGERVDVNRDIVGLAGANIAAGLTGTFVVNGSPTKTQILDEQKGRTQLANMTMSAVVLLFVLFFTGLLTDMPKAVLAGDRLPDRPRAWSTSPACGGSLPQRPASSSSRPSRRSSSSPSASSRASSSRSSSPSSRSSAASTSRSDFVVGVGRATAADVLRSRTPGARAGPG